MGFLMVKESQSTLGLVWGTIFYSLPLLQGRDGPYFLKMVFLLLFVLISRTVCK